MANSGLLRKQEDTLKSMQVEWVISVQQKFVAQEMVSSLAEINLGPLNMIAVIQTRNAFLYYES